jgi:peptide-methionine (S)-S-oxide reductase
MLMRSGIQSQIRSDGSRPPLRLPGLGLPRVLSIAAVLAVVAVGCAPLALSSEGGERARVIPAPAADENAVPAATSEVAVFAGGCFWGVQAVYQHVKGVTSAVSGYAGGSAKTASYDESSTGRTGHAEAVEVTFDPRQVTYGQLLHVFFSVAHDPTQLNRQGPDTGRQYRSTIFPASSAQARAAKAYIAQLNEARAFDAPIVTTIEVERPFYRAEDYHQDFLARNPRHPYIVINDLPKLGELKRVFPTLYQPTPVLVAGTR